jgi:hypothetical protein
LTARYCELLDRSDEAFEVLTCGARDLESALVVRQLAVLEVSLRHYDAARAAFERGEIAPIGPKACIRAPRRNKGVGGVGVLQTAAQIELAPGFAITVRGGRRWGATSEPPASLLA